MWRKGKFRERILLEYFRTIDALLIVDENFFRLASGDLPEAADRTGKASIAASLLKLSRKR
jgi:hypothetical protein